jgi:hypothetical protein
MTLFSPVKTLFAQMVIPDQPAQAPVPIAAPDQSGMIAAPAPMAIPAPAVVPSQLTWPDTVDLIENDPGLTQGDDPKIIELFKQAGEIFGKMSAIIDATAKSRMDLYQKYFELDAKLDEFLQNISLDEGVTNQEPHQHRQTLMHSNKTLTRSKHSLIMLTPPKML